MKRNKKVVPFRIIRAQRKQSCLRELNSGTTQTELAAKYQVNRRTIIRWKKEGLSLQELNDLRRWKSKIHHSKANPKPA